MVWGLDFGIRAGAPCQLRAGVNHLLGAGMRRKKRVKFKGVAACHDEDDHQFLTNSTLVTPEAGVGSRV